MKMGDAAWSQSWLQLERCYQKDNDSIYIDACLATGSRICPKL